MSAIMNQVLHPPLPLASDNPFSSEQECIDHIGSHAHHSSFAAGVPGRNHSASGILNSLPPSSITSRYSTQRPDAQYHSSTALSDTGSGSISTSPISNASSSIAFSSFASAGTYPNHIGIANNPISNFSYGYQPMSTTRRMSSMWVAFVAHSTDNSSSAMLPPARSSAGMGNPVSPSLGASARDNYTTSTPGLHRHPHTLSPRHSEVSRYSSLPDTPRSVLTPTMPLPTTAAYNASMSMYPQPDRSGETPPFNQQELWYTITCEGAKVTPTIDAKIEKGFFYSSDHVWTCYRRNYFAVQVSFGINPWVSNARLYLDQGGSKGPEQIQSMAVSLAAAVDGSNGKGIELIQHTPKRDKGPQLTMKKELLEPTPPGKHDHSGYGLNGYNQSTTVAGPHLPLQKESDTSHQQYSPASHTNTNYQHAFERIQFKSATANNGKRRAQQQYYCLIVELWANVQNPRDANPVWVKIGARSSQPVVVRGRSPSHYSHEGPHNAGASRGGGSLGGPGSGHPGLGSNGGQSYGRGYGNGLSGSGGATLGGGMYRGTTYSLDPSPVGSHSVSSASSLSGGNVDGLVGDQHMVEEEDSKMMGAHDGYQYYPSPIYDGLPKVENSGLPHPDRRIKEEFPAIATGWQGGGCGRFQGLETSRGYYPDVHAAGY